MNKNKSLIASVLVTLCSTPTFAEVKPFIGISMNTFSIISNGLSAQDTSIGFSGTSTVSTRDRGTTSGINGGFILSDNKKINFSYFSGKEENSKILTTTVTSISIDHSFNGTGIHQGWFIGAGLSSVEVTAEKTLLTTAGEAKASGALLRGGYEYLFDNNLFLEIGFNSNLADLNLKFNGTGVASNLEFDSTMKVSNFYISLSHAF